jgi:hypothetical protein
VSQTGWLIGSLADWAAAKEFFDSLVRRLVTKKETMQSIQFQNTPDDLQDYFYYWAFKTTDGQKWVKQLHKSIQALGVIGVLLIWGFSNL